METKIDVIEMMERLSSLNLDEAMALRDKLVSDVESIQAQLGDANRLDPETGQRMEYEAYQGWRKRAISALRGRHEDLRIVKQRIREISGATGWALLARCHKFITQAHERFEDVDDSEMVTFAEELLDAIEAEVPGKVLHAS